MGVASFSFHEAPSATKMARAREMTAARFSARTRVSTLDAEQCRLPIAVFRELSERERSGGSVLVESVARGSRGGTRSLVVPGRVVRLLARCGRVSFEALCQRGERVVNALGERRGYPRVAPSPVRHRRYRRLGLQFHPESILTPWGRKLLWRYFDEACLYGVTT